MQLPPPDPGRQPGSKGKRRAAQHTRGTFGYGQVDGWGPLRRGGKDSQEQRSTVPAQVHIDDPELQNGIQNLKILARIKSIWVYRKMRASWWSAFVTALRPKY